MRVAKAPVLRIPETPVKQTTSDLPFVFAFVSHFSWLFGSGLLPRSTLVCLRAPVSSAAGDLSTPFAGLSAPAPDTAMDRIRRPPPFPPPFSHHLTSVLILLLPPGFHGHGEGCKNRLEMRACLD